MSSQFHIGGHPVWRKDQILTLEECVKSDQDVSQTLNTDQAMQELNQMLQLNKQTDNQDNNSSASSSCSEKSHSLYQNEMGRPHHSERAVHHDQDMHDRFNPATTQFTDEELKPSPLQRKSRKVLVKEEDKDDRYWEKRKKNNMAAKRSREARRSRENQIALRASYLEKDNALLKEELLNVKEELQQMREQLLLVQQQRSVPKQ